MVVSRKAIGVFCVVLVLFIVLLTVGMWISSVDNTKDEMPENVEWMSAEALCRSFNEDEQEARKAYINGEAIKVTGIVLETGVDGGGYAYAVLHTAPHMKNRVYCYFETDKNTENIQKGYEITVYGSVFAYMNYNPMLERCKLLELYKEPYYLQEAEETLITLAEFERLQDGMTYEACCEIIGGLGSLTVESKAGQSEFATYLWSGNGGIGTNATASFLNGRLSAKAQIGLK